MIDGISWDATYRLIIQQGTGSNIVASLSCYANIVNQLDSKFDLDPLVTLISGDIQHPKAKSNLNPYKYKRTRGGSSSDSDDSRSRSRSRTRLATDPPPKERDADMTELQMNASAEEVLGKFTFQLPNPVKIVEKSTTTVPLFSSPNIKAVESFKFSLMVPSSAYYGNTLALDRVEAQTVLQFSNTKENGLGVTMPSGQLNTFVQNEGELLQFISQHNLGRKAPESDIIFPIGKTSLVTAGLKIISSTHESTKTGHHKIRRCKTVLSVKITNRLQRPAFVLVFADSYGSEFKWLNVNVPHDPPNDRHLKVTVGEIAPDATFDLLLTYDYRIY